MRQPYWRKSCKAWYVLHDEKQYCLGKTKEESERAVHKLMVGQTEPTPRATVNEVVSQFLSWTDGHRSALTYEWYCHFLNSFTALYGELRVSELEPFHVKGDYQPRIPHLRGEVSSVDIDSPLSREQPQGD